MVVPGNVNAPWQSSKPMKEIMNRIEKTSIFQARARARALQLKSEKLMVFACVC